MSPGQKAPDFELHSTPDQTVALSDFRGKPVVLVFYPADWSPVCGDQIGVYNEMQAEFDEYTRSCSAFRLTASGATGHSPKHVTSISPCSLTSNPKATYRVATAHIARRTASPSARSFVIDAEGVVRWSYLSPVGVNPGADGIFAALDALTPEQRGEPAAASKESSS